MRFCLCIAAAASLLTGQASPPQTVARVPLVRGDRRLETPARYDNRQRVDPQTGRLLSYDPKPQVILIDSATGRYSLRWVGNDGVVKAVTYQRPDAINVIVSASAVRTQAGLYEYSYRVDNPTTGEELSGFAVQAFSKSITPVPQANLHTGIMGPAVFPLGQWTRFGPMDGFQPRPLPGRAIVVQLRSPAWPGLVECRAHGGELATKGVGEELPFELERQLLGPLDWPRGFTIGPIDELSTLPRPARVEKILAWFPSIQSAGWITGSVRQKYERALRSGDTSILSDLDADLGRNLITTEVVAILRPLAR
jgi:hypothetical protein